MSFSFYGLVFLGWCHTIKSNTHRGLWNFSLAGTVICPRMEEGRGRGEDGTQHGPLSISPEKGDTSHSPSIKRAVSISFT